MNTLYAVTTQKWIGTRFNSFVHNTPIVTVYSVPAESHLEARNKMQELIDTDPIYRKEKIIDCHLILSGSVTSIAHIGTADLLNIPNSEIEDADTSDSPYKKPEPDQSE